MTANKPQQKNTSVANQQVIVIAVCAVLTVILAYLSVRSFIDFRNDSGELRKLESLKTRLEGDYISLNNLIAQYSREQDKFQKMLFKEQDVPLFLEEIAVFAADAGVKILDVKTRTFVKVNYSDPDKAKKNKAPGQEQEEGMVLTSLPVNVSIQGTFESIVKFLMKLEKYKQLLTLGDVDIKVKGYPQLSCSLTVSIYSLRDMKVGTNK